MELLTIRSDRLSIGCITTDSVSIPNWRRIFRESSPVPCSMPSDKPSVVKSVLPSSLPSRYRIYQRLRSSRELRFTFLSHVRSFIFSRIRSPFTQTPRERDRRREGGGARDTPRGSKISLCNRFEETLANSLDDSQPTLGYRIGSIAILVRDADEIGRHFSRLTTLAIPTRSWRDARCHVCATCAKSRYSDTQCTARRFAKAFCQQFVLAETRGSYENCRVFPK